MINKNYEAAFPSGPQGDSKQYEDGHIEHQYPGSMGMSLLDYFAAKVIAGMYANQHYNDVDYERMAMIALNQAEAIIKALKEAKQ